MYSVGMAYLLWLPSLFGLSGLQRFYLGKFGTGVLFLITGGLLGIGTIYDAFTLPRQVREAQLHEKYREALGQGTIHINVERSGTAGSARNSGRPTSVEQVILQSAGKNNGVVTPTDVALAAGVPLEEARRVLEQLSEKGFAEVRVKKSGLLVYVIPDLEDEHRSSDLEDF
ncbi:MAG: NINE protein [Spirochaetaceae bacterium]|nr:MAG: NINE protein [Spirochaetaceae bacterium]